MKGYERNALKSVRRRLIEIAEAIRATHTPGLDYAARQVENQAEVIETILGVSE